MCRKGVGVISRSVSFNVISESAGQRPAKTLCQRSAGKSTCCSLAAKKVARRAHVRHKTGAMVKTTEMKRGDLSQFADKAKISVSYAHDLLSEPGSKRHKKPPMEMALLIYRRTGRMLGFLVGATPQLAKRIVELAASNGSIPANDD